MKKVFVIIAVVLCLIFLLLPLITSSKIKNLESEIANLDEIIEITEKELEEQLEQYRRFVKYEFFPSDQDSNTKLNSLGDIIKTHRSSLETYKNIREKQINELNALKKKFNK